MWIVDNDSSNVLKSKLDDALVDDALVDDALVDGGTVTAVGGSGTVVDWRFPISVLGHKTSTRPARSTFQLIRRPPPSRSPEAPLATRKPVAFGVRRSAFGVGEREREKERERKEREREKTV